MKWFGILSLVFLLIVLAGLVYMGANTDKIGFLIIPGAWAIHDPSYNHPSYSHPTPQPDQSKEPSPFVNPITMTLNQDGYQTGETIKVSGTVGNTNSDSFVIFTLFKSDETLEDSLEMMLMLKENGTDVIPSPITSINENAIVTTTMMMLDDNGTVSYQFTAGNGNMDVSGMYSIEMKHKSLSATREFHFQVIEEEPYFGIFVYIDNLFSWITGN